ncbi:MAG: hypothetical protein GY828_00445, partial [Candidatus Gracilibacteria bacterium]|nr:hypothetical protein [Candidatus Gracilibacteria bacterium]
YDVKRYFNTDEIAGLYIYAGEMYRNEETAINNSTEEKFKQLIDFDANGMLESEVNFNMGELQGDYLSDRDGESKIGILYANLGIEEIESEMEQNFFTAHEKFQNALGMYLRMGVKPAELFVEGGVKTVLNKLHAENTDNEKLLAENEANVLFVSGVVEKELANKIQEAQKGESNYE